jgi:hypothetical protein
MEVNSNNRRGIHTKPNKGKSDEWLTPPDIVEALGTFDLDPCAHPDQFYRTAKRMIAPPQNGLAEKWKGRVWLNPPFSQNQAWMARMVEHGNGILLAASRTEVERWFWKFIWLEAHAILFIRGRLYFRLPDGSKLGNAGHGTVLCAYGAANVRRLKNCKIPGKFFDLRATS